MARTTINDVARKAGVSAMTVSRVINNKGEISQATRQRVQQAIDQLGYRPSKVARSLSTSRSYTIGLIVPDITNPFFPEIIQGAEDAAWQAGYTITLCGTGEDPEREAKALETLEDNRVDGVIVCSARLPKERLLQLIVRHQAAVLLNRSVPSAAAGMVSMDDAYGTMRVVHHLLGIGRERIGFLAGPATSQSGRKRNEGYHTALEATGHRVDEDLQESCPPNEHGGYQAFKLLHQRHRDLNGLICYNDLVAIGALQACAELGIGVPDDIAVVGCDDIRMASLVTPSLTTLAVDKYHLGRKTVTMLLERIGGKSSGPLILRPELIVRQSAPEG